MTQALVFIGVSTGGSSIVRIFPRWARVLGINAELVGRDIPPRAEPDAYRAAVAEIGRDERLRGALVTTHKVDVFRHAHDLFSGFDEDARLCGEVSCISKRDGALWGHAKDPETAGRALAEMLAPDHFPATGAHVLCLGAGGAGTAITVRLLSRGSQPQRIVVTDVDRARIEALRRVHAQLSGGKRVAYRVVAGAGESDALVAELPPRSLVVNATGLGKDAPGSPLSDAARFPERAVVWELNYRGDLEFLLQARRQAAELSLDVHDGWRYFLHGWTAVTAEVFGLSIEDEVFAHLVAAAEEFRPTVLD